MYRPPENANRVQRIRNIFENNKEVKQLEHTPSSPPLSKQRITKSKTELDLRHSSRCHQNLNRQLSDPAKRNNIKRTPAFRLDKNAIAEKNPNRYQSKVKHYDCDKAKSNKCLDDGIFNFSDIRSRFSCNQSSQSSEINNSISTNNVENDNNISFLYAKPIPKALRVKKCGTSPSSSLLPRNSDEESYCNKQIMKVEKQDIMSLTDTLKCALKKPLPVGPAPKKPPRTFLHSSQQNYSAAKVDKFFLSDSLNKKLQQKNTTSRGKGDPKYMLDKLEKMLKSKKQNCVRKAEKTDIEDSDDDDGDNDDDDDDDDDDGGGGNNELNTTTRLTHDNTFNIRPVANNNIFNNLNCLNALGCNTTTYDRIQKTNSSFFVDYHKEEPVYAEPFQFVENANSTKQTEGKKHLNKEQRNRLYYMSSQILRPNDNMCSIPSAEKSLVHATVHEKQLVTCDDTSSLSSAYASDVESAEENIGPIQKNKKIKDIIKVFELRNNCQPKPCSKGIDRIKELENQLRKTLDRTFSDRTTLISMDACSETSCSGCSATESGHEDEIVNKFETYVKTVRIYAKSGVKRDEHLFDCCLLVGLNKRIAYIKMKFPDNVEIPAKIEQLCFPDGIDGPMDRSDKAQCYSLVITDENGKRTFGYCRRILPEGSENCLPLAYCILSKHRAPRFYKRILKELESRHGLPDKLRDALLSEFYYRHFPSPGESIKIDLTKIKETIDNEIISVNSDSVVKCETGIGCEKNKLDLRSYVIVNNSGEYGTLKKTPNVDDVQSIRKPIRGQSAFIHLETASLNNNLKRSLSSPSLDKDLEMPPTELILALHQDSRYEETGLKDLHCILNTNILQKVFASLLLERKVILVSCVLSKLSSCVESLQSILYPFCWPHTLIPVLPQSLWEIVEAPTPFVCGVLSVAVVNMYRIDNALIVDLDEAAVLSEVGDEDKILPSALIKTWKSGLSVAKSVPVTDSAYSVLLSDAYLRVFIHSCGHYKNYIVNGNFQKDTFIQHVKGKGLRRFLTWFTETTMFYTFLDQFQNDPSSFAIFDKRIQIYGSEESDTILEKMKDWKKEKTLSGFFKFDS